MCDTGSKDIPEFPTSSNPLVHALQVAVFLEGLGFRPVEISYALGEYQDSKLLGGAILNTLIWIKEQEAEKGGEEKGGSPLRYAERLVEELHKKYYSKDSGGWKPLYGDLLGLLIQIDNMVSGLERPDRERESLSEPMPIRWSFTRDGIMLTEAIAKVCHETNKSYCETLGDSTQLPWMSAPDWQKESAIDGVQNIIQNPDCTPENSHNCWLEVKKKYGWVYGEVKDLDNKTHPCMVPYDDLPFEQKIKDQLFLAVAKTLIQRNCR